MFFGSSLILFCYFERLHIYRLFVTYDNYGNSICAVTLSWMGVTIWRCLLQNWRVNLEKCHLK